jgi:uncharacterized membrane protein YjdF
MKLLHYFLGFTAFALAHWVFTEVLCCLDTPVTNYIMSCLVFGLLATTAVYNLIQGYKLQKSEY